MSRDLFCAKCGREVGVPRRPMTRCWPCDLFPVCEPCLARHEEETTCAQFRAIEQTIEEHLDGMRKTLRTWLLPKPGQAKERP